MKHSHPGLEAAVGAVGLAALTGVALSHSNVPRGYRLLTVPFVILILLLIMSWFIGD